MKTPHHISGAHLLLVANNSGGSAKTTYAAEARVACAMHGIPHRLVTFDASNQTLNGIFRDDGVNYIAKSNSEALLESFAWHIAEALKAGEIIIADMPSCIADPDSPIMKAFSDSQILAGFESIGLLVPVTATYHSIESALEALAAYKAAGIKHNRGLVRAWHADPARPTWDSFTGIAELKALFPFWNCNSYMQSMEDMMQARGDFTAYPALDKLPKKFAEDASAMSTRERGQLRFAVRHLEEAKEAIYEHLLKPIVENPTKSAATA